MKETEVLPIRPSDILEISWRHNNQVIGPPPDDKGLLRFLDDLGTFVTEALPKDRAAHLIVAVFYDFMEG